jgi:hypothetical protein
MELHGLDLIGMGDDAEDVADAVRWVANPLGHGAHQHFRIATFTSPRVNIESRAA